MRLSPPSDEAGATGGAGQDLGATGARVESLEAFKTAVTDEHSLCFGLLDVDHFKQVNDGYSHEVGDQALKVIAETMKITRKTNPELLIIEPKVNGEFTISLSSGLKSF